MPAFPKLNLFVLSRVDDFAMKAAKALPVDGYDCWGDSRYWIATITGCKMVSEKFRVLKSSMHCLSASKACKVWQTTASLEKTFKKGFRRCIRRHTLVLLDQAYKFSSQSTVTALKICVEGRALMLASNSGVQARCKRQRLDEFLKRASVSENKNFLILRAA